MNSDTDTIAAIATAPGEGAISIVRVSGPDSLGIADAIVRCAGPRPSERKANTFFHAFVRPPAGTREESQPADVDEVIVLVYRAPHSFTREDVLEIQGHGGRLAAQRVLRAALLAGARPAEPGEFTKRAFLSGRIDLLQAEAVLDVIRARSDRASMAAMEQLEGGLSRQILRQYDALITLAADMEACLDFPEQDLPAIPIARLAERTGSVIREMDQVLGSWHDGHILRDGALVVIIGKPNVGKSTLFNCLLDRERAIVHDLPGTTRDSIEEELVLSGVPVRLIDTAGIREPQCLIEKKSIDRSMSYLEKADLFLDVLDASVPLDNDDLRVLAATPPERCLVVMNKADIGLGVDISQLSGRECVRAILTRNEGIDQIRRAIINRIGLTCSVLQHAVISERHRDLLTGAASRLRESKRMLDTGENADLSIASAEIRESLDLVGQIIGRVHYDDLLSSVFSRFCIGK